MTTHELSDASSPETCSQPSLVVIMPALNEEATIADVIGRVPSSIDGVGSIEVVVVDDGSTDHTARLAREAGTHVVSHPENRGVGAAFATGIDAALRLGADIIVNIDSDRQFAQSSIAISGANANSGNDAHCYAS